jgi:hypothetical protein
VIHAKHEPLHKNKEKGYFFAVTVIFLGFASAARGAVTVTIPSSISAFKASELIGRGRLVE